MPLSTSQKAASLIRFRANPEMEVLRLVWDMEERFPGTIKEILAGLEKGLSAEITARLNSKINELHVAGYAAITGIKKGEKGDSPTDAHIVSLIKPLIPAPLKANDGLTPSKRELLALIKSVMPKVKNGQPPTKAEIIALIKEVYAEKEIEEAANAQTAEPDDTSVDIATKINMLQEQIEPHAIKGLNKIVEELKVAIRKVSQSNKKQSGGGDVVTAGTNVTITRTAGGKRSIAAAGGTGTVYTELLTDSGDHKNFTALHTINSVFSLMDGSGKGVPLKDGSGATNYTVSGLTLTLVAADANLASIGLCIIYS